MSTTAYVPQHVMQQAALVAWSTAMGAVTPEALADRDQVPLATARERLDEAVRLGLLERHSLLVDHPALYTVTPAGRKLARKHADTGAYAYPQGLRSSLVSIKGARHMIACAGVRVAIERRYADYRVIGEQELHRDEREVGRTLATVEIRGTSAGRRLHSPDIVVWPPAVPEEIEVPLPVAVEVELSSKRKEELMENLRAWAQCRYVEAVIYFAETRKIEEQLLDGIEYLKAEEAIVVNPLSEILKPLPGFPLTDD
jgi:DNA-binding MarR family transcriptional regulator